MAAERSSTPAEAAGSQRLDKWLWFARIVKTRALAAALVSDGRVRINRTRALKPSQTVRPGDVLAAVVNHRLRVLQVLGLGHRRGPPAEAHALYEELTPVGEGPIPQGNALPSGRSGRPLPQAGAVVVTPRAGRPTKRERRHLDRVKRKGF